MSTDYEAIRQKNIKEYGEGTRHLSYFADIYSTRTHFIFEVLQNAEDALSRRPAGSVAGYVRFHLHPDRLEIRHNGVPFNEFDVNGICGIGEGTKAGDFTQIGKFGIGFKSVYAYTFFPKIHSGDEHFEIRRFVEPQAIASVNGKDTLIILPFDQPDKRPDWAFRENVTGDVAVREIGDAIQKLGIRTMLFLRHIDEIQWSLPGERSGHFIRSVEAIPGHDDLRKVEVLDNSENIEEWRIFQQCCKVEDGGKAHDVTVEVAYLVKEGTIARAGDTELVVYFPTEKKTELGFLVQAPFKTTKARDNIKSDDLANRQMIGALAELTASSLEKLRDLGLLNVASYNALPLRPQDFPEKSLFRPVYEKVRETLKTQRLLPAHGGGFVCASEAKLARGKELVELFSPEQLGALFGKKDLFWLDDEITESGTTADLHRYLKDVVEDIQPQKLKDRLTAAFFEAQNEEWLIKFYAYLEKNFATLQNTSFLRLENNQHVSVGTVEKPNAYLPSTNVADINQAIFPLVKTTLASNPEVAKFLRQIVHLREPDKIDVVIRCLLPKFGTEIVTFERDGYVHDLKEIAAAYSSVKPNDATRLVDKLKETKFVAAVPANSPQSGVVWVKPGDSALYRQSLELEQWFAGNETDVAWFPLPVVGENLLGDLKDKLGFTNATLIKRSPPNRYKKSEGGFDSDADIVGIQYALRNITFDRAKFIWDKLLDNIPLIKGKELISETLAFTLDRTKEVNTSKLGSRCMEKAWLPVDEEYCKPSDVLLSELPDKFKQHSLADALSRALGMKQPVDLSPIAIAFGITSEEAERRMSVTPEEMKEIEQRRQEKLSSPTLPNKISSDPKRREKKIGDEAQSTPAKTTEVRPQSVYPDYPEAQGEARSYLKYQYTNDDVMFCQLCLAPQPVILNGEPSFEAVDCVKGLNTHHEQNNLALCPNHAAMYKNGGLTPDTVQCAVLECEGQRIPLNLAGNAVELYFTQQHLGDLRATLSALDSEEK